LDLGSCQINFPFPIFCHTKALCGFLIEASVHSLEPAKATDFSDMRVSTIAGAIAGFAAVSVAIPTLSIKGSKFFTSDGDQFYIKGALRLVFAHICSLAY
jgi:hypothetical protein